MQWPVNDSSNSVYVYLRDYAQVKSLEVVLIVVPRIDGRGDKAIVLIERVGAGADLQCTLAVGLVPSRSLAVRLPSWSPEENSPSSTVSDTCKRLAGLGSAVRLKVAAPPFTMAGPAAMLTTGTSLSSIQTIDLLLPGKPKSPLPGIMAAVMTPSASFLLSSRVATRNFCGSLRCTYWKLALVAIVSNGAFHILAPRVNRRFAPCGRSATLQAYTRDHPA